MDAGTDRFEFIAHTADIAVRLRAGTRDGLFDMAAGALTETITDREAVGREVTRVVSLEAGELDLLLVDWLHELLYLFETRGLLTGESRARVARQAAGWRLDAQIAGETRDPARHPIKVLVKAVTYHGLSIECTDEGYAATVIFDV